MTLDELYEIFIEDKKIDIIQATVETIENRYVVISRYFGKSNISNTGKQRFRCNCNNKQKRYDYIWRNSSRCNTNICDHNNCSKI